MQYLELSRSTVPLWIYLAVHGVFGSIALWNVLAALNEIDL